MPSATKFVSKAKPLETGTFASAEKRILIVCLLLAAATLVLYNPVTRHPFVNYDDDKYITSNPHIRAGLTWDTFIWALTSTEQANWHPLTWISHEVDVSLFRLNPAGHHFTNVLLHIANVVLLFLLLWRGTRRLGASLVVAGLFAAHPINVESVAWIAERKNVLCTLFFLLAIGAYGWYAKKPSWKRYLAVFGFFAAGLASKPMVITLPFVLLLLDYWPLARTTGPAPQSWSKLFWEKIPLLALSAASAAITIVAQKSGGAIRSVEEISLAARLKDAPYAYAMYLWKAIWPAKLAPFYPHPGDSLAAWKWIVALAILIAITAIVLHFREKRYLLMGWCWFLGTLVPVIGLVSIGEALMADRYAYIPLIGVFLAIVFAVADLIEGKQLPSAVPIAAAVAILAALAWMTHRQTGYWQTNEALWAHALAVTPDNFVAENNLGGALILEGREEEAHPHFERGAQLNPQDPMSRANLATYSMTHGHLSEAIQQYQEAVKLTSDPTFLAQTYANMGMAQRSAGQSEQARTSFEQALSLDQRQFIAWAGLGLLAQSEGKVEEAVNDFSRSVELQPTASGYLQLGRVYEQTNQPTRAFAAYQQALKIDPNLADAQQALDRLGQRQ